MTFDRRAIEGHLRGGQWAVTRADSFLEACRERLIETAASSPC
jgi:hypothetical protein